MFVGAAVAIIAAVAAATPSMPYPMDHDCFYNVGTVGAADFASAAAILDVDAEAVQHAYPDRALRMLQGGQASFACDSDGAHLTNCVVTSDEPVHFGFAKATQILLGAGAVRMHPTGTAGKIEGVVRFKIAQNGETRIC